MFKKLKMLLILYAVPLLIMLTFGLTGTFTLNGKPLGILGLMLMGFLIGSIAEGLTMFFTATIVILTSKNTKQ